MDHSNTSSPSTLNIVTLNCWGLKYLAKYRNERLLEIGRRLATANPKPEIVGLQECWTQEDYLSIHHQTKHLLPYAKFYYSGIFGGGLAILSKWPIEESSMVRYSLNGRPTAFFRGDWFVGKGVACARIGIGQNPRDVVEVFCTHLHAPYEPEPNDSYLCHRTAQAWEIAKLMRGAIERGHLVIGMGDFNMVPLSLAHRLITTHAHVQDAWQILYPDSSVGAAKDLIREGRRMEIPSAYHNLTANGATCDSVLNTWRWSKEQQKRLFRGKHIYVDEQTEDPGAKRLDYLFIGNGRSFGLGAAPQWTVQNVKVGMTARHPTLGCSLSDHFSVEATLSMQKDRDAHLVGSNDHVDSFDSDEPSRMHLSVSINSKSADSPSQQMSPLDPLILNDILSMINSYTRRERRQRRLRLSHFGVSVVVSLGCLVAIWWSPHPFVSFILMLLSTLGFGAGIIDGLIGGLFVGSEVRALKEFEWEMRNAKEKSTTSKVEEKVVA